MKKIFILSFCVLFLSQSYGQKGVLKKTESKVSLQEVLLELKKVTDEVSTINTLDGVFDISIKLNEVVANNSGFEFSVLLFSFKKSRNKTVDNSFTTKYKFKTEKTNANKQDFEENLANYINSAIHSYVDSKPYELIKNGFTIVSSFTIECNTEGGISALELKPITVGFNLKRNKKSLHTVTVEFKPNPKEKPLDHKKLQKESNELLKKSNELLEKSNEIRSKKKLVTE